MKLHKQKIIYNQTRNIKTITKTKIKKHQKQTTTYGHKSILIKTIITTLQDHLVALSNSNTNNNSNCNTNNNNNTNNKNHKNNTTNNNNTNNNNNYTNNSNTKRIFIKIYQKLQKNMIQVNYLVSFKHHRKNFN